MPLRIFEPSNRNGLRSHHCGGCVECCRAMAVPELPKPEFTTCPHQEPGGCGIYATRPEPCVSFRCGYITRWLDKYGSEARPDRCKVIAWGMKGTVWGDVLTLSECVPYATQQGIGARMLADMAATQLVLVVNKRSRQLCGPPQVVAEAKRKMRGDIV